MSGYAILWLTNDTLDVESSSTPVKTIFSPRASGFSVVLIYAILAVIEVYFPASSLDNVMVGIGSRKDGGAGRDFGSGYKSLSI